MACLYYSYLLTKNKKNNEQKTVPKKEVFQIQKI